MAVLAACGGEAERHATRPPIRGRALEQMSFGQSTPADVERVFGAADERPPDGSLVYRTEDRHAGRRETESVTFRFEGGVLSRICRNRSQ